MKIDEPSASSAQGVRESLLQSLIDQSPAFIAVRAIDGIYLYANNAFAGALGVPPEQIVGHREEDLVAGAGIPPQLRAGSAVAEGGEVRSVVEEAAFGTSQRRLLITRFPIRAHGEVFATGLIASDIGAAVHAESGVQASLERAEASNAELRRALERMERLAYTDRLTGAWNRRHLDDAVVIEMSRTERHGHPVSMLLIDIDHFKALNDGHGHPVGDRVLIELVRCLRAGLRRADTVTRWGGEEFIVLAPDTPLAEAGQLAHKLGLRVAASIMVEALPAPVTVSIGVAEYQAGEGFEAWLLRADRALYRAKQGGRNRSVADPLTAFGEHAGAPARPSLVKLMWRAAYDSGDRQVDRQHRGLFERANRLLDVVLAGASREVVLTAARELVADIAAHFADEERLHERIGYPQRQAHAAEHATLLAKAERLSERAACEALPPAELFQFLAYEVISQHLLGADRHYFRYLDEPGPATSVAG